MPLDPTLSRLRDADILKTIALPNGAATVTSAGVDLGSNRHGSPAELLVLAPALNATQLPNTQTMTYSVEFAAASDFGTVTRAVPVGVQTGAGGVGAIADQYRCGIASDADRYVRLKVVKSGTGDASGVVGTIGVAV